MTHRKSTAGFSFVEVAVAAGILGITVLFGLSVYRTHFEERSDIRGRMAILQVEQAIRAAVSNAMANYFCQSRPAPLPCANPAPCDAGQLRARLTAQALPSGIAFTLPGDQLIDQRLAEGTGTNDPALQDFQLALGRCRNSPVPGQGNPALANRRGLYFCLDFTPNGAFRTSISSLIDNMRPFVGEFYYTNYLFDGLPIPPPVPGPPVDPRELTCATANNLLTAATPAFPAHRRPVVGLLHYRLYWTPRGADGRTGHKSTNGIVYVGY